MTGLRKTETQARGHRPGSGRKRRHRQVDYLRISVTDRCNFRCGYCMPPEGVPSRSHDEILSYEEIIQFTRVAARLGISRVRVTGGEPLVRRQCVDLVEALAAVTGIEDVAMTTNGSLLAGYADDLKRAGLKRVNISIDSFKPGRFGAISGGADPGPSLAGLDAALAAGLEPVKINAVILPGIEDELDSFIGLARQLPLHVRFIEPMPFNGRKEAGEVTGGARKLLARLIEKVDLRPLPHTRAPLGAGPASYFDFSGARGTLGIISMTNHFCSRCNRLRLTAEGRMRGCLFSGAETDTRPLFAQGDEALAAAISKTIDGKLYDWRRCRPAADHRAMAQIGG